MYFFKKDIKNIINFIISKKYNNNSNDNYYNNKHNNIIFNNEENSISLIDYETLIVKILTELYNENNYLKDEIIKFIDYLDNKLNNNIKFKILFINNIS